MNSCLTRTINTHLILVIKILSQPSINNKVITYPNYRLDHMFIMRKSLAIKINTQSNLVHKIIVILFLQYIITLYEIIVRVFFI